MKARRVRRSVSALTAAMVVALPVGAATATPDQQGPVLKTPTYAQFVPGSQVWGRYRDADYFNTYGIPARVPWKAWDRSGVCGVTVEEVYAWLAPRVVVANAPSRGAYVGAVDDYDGTFGGGSEKIEGWRVTASDCVGNQTVAEVAGATWVVQEDNSTPDEFPSGVVLEFRGRWRTVDCTDCLAGAAKVTRRAGARVRIEATPGAQVALVLRQGPRYGRAKVYIDGERVGSVNTYSADPVERTIVWTRKLKDSESTITVVNARRHHRHHAKRLGLDAVITRPG